MLVDSYTYPILIHQYKQCCVRRHKGTVFVVVVVFNYLMYSALLDVTSPPNALPKLMLAMLMVLTSLSSTASQPHSSRYSLLPHTPSGQEHGETSGGSTRTCFYPGCCQRPLTRRQNSLRLLGYEMVAA